MLTDSRSQVVDIIAQEETEFDLDLQITELNYEAESLRAAATITCEGEYSCFSYCTGGTCYVGCSTTYSC